jgi:hypothetical protein
VETNARSLLRTLVLAVTLLFLVVAELQALNALASQEPKRENATTVYTAIVLGLIVVAYLALFGAPRTADEKESPQHRHTE